MIQTIDMARLTEQELRRKAAESAARQEAARGRARRRRSPLGGAIRRLTAR